MLEPVQGEGGFIPMPPEFVQALRHICDEHGIVYVDDEVQPSIDILRADGFTPTAFAYPHGAYSKELDEAIARRIAITRAISGHPRA